jgi:NADPH-dependent 2,4-dienoyl-CoA reductase/sulfur reductase-like enzyme
MKQGSKSKGTTEAERVRFGEPRRYLVDVDSISTNQLFTDCVIVGAGLAGLRAAIEAADQIGRAHV